MNLESIMLSKISKMEKNEYCMVTYMWNLKNKTKTPNK